eukprot:gene8050-8913_t
MANQKYSAIQLEDDDEDEEEELVIHSNTEVDQDLPKAADDLKFHDYKEVSLLPTVKPDADTSTENQGSMQQGSKRTLLGDDFSDDDGDKAELLAGQKKQPSFWTFEYYQAFFDVDTNQVLTRILYSMLPTYKRNFLTTKVRPNPDLYGPFWVCATLVFTIAISGNLASYFASEGNTKWIYDFHKVTFAGLVIYSYAWLIPALLWGFFMWRGNQAGFLFLEIVCVYGYSLSIFIPISILWVLPQDWLRWTLVVVGVLLSGSVLVLTFLRAVEDDNKKVLLATIATIVILHCALAIGFKLYFFKTKHIAIDAQKIVNTIAPTLISTISGNRSH